MSTVGQGGDGSTADRSARGEHADGRADDGDGRRRRLAGGLALGLAVAMVVVPVVQILLLADAVPPGEGLPGRWSFLPITLAEAAPWFVGVALLQLRRHRLATAVLATAALTQVVFALPAAVAMLSGAGSGLRPVDLVVPVGFTAVAGVIAWLVWSSRVELAPEPRRAVPRFVGVATGFVALTAVFVTVVPLAPASRTPVAGWFPTTVGSGQFGDLPIALWTVLPVLLLIGLVVAAYRLGGDVAGAILLTFAGPRLISEVTTHVVNMTVWDGMITPVGGLVLIGLVAMIAAGIHLLGPTATDEPVRPVRSRPTTPSVAGD